ncbi:MAG: ATP-dependent helicase [Kiritimatiellaeota bacterium]|nr:ATP-dependent helicase [Kiritimatiellota bacterium]
MKLNVQQRAVVSRLTGPTLVVAGAGTGKTRVIAARTAALLEAGALPARLLLLTFTRRAAEEMKTRVARLTDGKAILPWCGTFHAAAARMLRAYGGGIGVGADFTVLDEADSRDLLGAILHQSVPNKDTRKSFPAPGMLSRIQSYAVNRRCSLEEAVMSLAVERFCDVLDGLAAIYTEYAARKRAANALDYDDLLVRWRDLLRADGDRCRDLFDHVMVDEYQDTNILQAEILGELCVSHRNVMVVGDDAQAIYAFRGATVDNILEFTVRFPGTVRLSLEQNYRSTQPILDAANALIREAAEGFDKTLFTHRRGGEPPEIRCCDDTHDEARRTAADVARAWRRQDTPLHEQAVLFRSAFHSFRLELALQEQQIPYRKFGGPRFAESAHIKDVLAFLRCRQNPHDEAAWRRILKLLPGVGDATAARIFRTLIESAEPVGALSAVRWPLRSVETATGFVETIRELFQTTEGSSPDLELGVICDFYEPLLPELYPLADQRIAGLRELRLAAARYPDRKRFLDEVLVGDDSVFATRDQAPGDYLTLSTIHSAKGREWDTVYVIHLVEGALPAGPALGDPKKIEEERRLLYVAVTRARNRLVLSYPAARETFVRGHSTYTDCRPSRFLSAPVRACCRSSRGFPATELVYAPVE